MITVMGATSRIAESLIGRLTELGVPCRALSRRPDLVRAQPAPGSEIRYADAADSSSLRAAFRGAAQLFLTMTNGPAQLELEARAVDVAAEQGIGHVVKLSAPMAAPDSPVAVSRWHYAIEEALRATGMAATILRPYAFMQKLLLLAPGVAEHGVIVGSSGAAACNYIDCRDIGEVAAAALTRTEIAGGAYVLTGSQTYGYPRIAEMLGDLRGAPVRYVDLPPDEFRAHLIERSGLPNWLAAHITEIQQLTLTHPEHPTDTVAHILDRAPRTLESFLAENAVAFRARAVTR
ncbi:NAD(P)H-binding protein [Nocardia sp. ET3-3]|uniref:NAD(P)H-binding protein n=1 Tax=Nocardia terrae TaxID=2675851 RepID=A0A7K1V7J2_9NOCA|nr:NmrA family NAD(P)-binding protein [Nocardia terrae]MVU82596.1 NAD(P)H-binding protein [Nocardia terrae]